MRRTTQVNQPYTHTYIHVLSISLYDLYMLLIYLCVCPDRSMVQRRIRLPSACVSGGVNVWSILSANIGKDLSKVAMPVQLNEPVNTLQRLCEEMEYCHLLDTAAHTQDPHMRMVRTKLRDSLTGHFLRNTILIQSRVHLPQAFRCCAFRVVFCSPQFYRVI